tara:strand:+ start:2701 stop:2901 length:201 start_codon:yes stop_codon:yes gene_type:complete
VNIIKEMIGILESDKGDSIYLREIALLMEENDLLRVEIGELKKELKLRDKMEKVLLRNQNVDGGKQ